MTQHKVHFAPSKPFVDLSTSISILISNILFYKFTKKIKHIVIFLEILNVWVELTINKVKQLLFYFKAECLFITFIKNILSCIYRKQMFKNKSLVLNFKIHYRYIILY